MGNRYVKDKRPQLEPITKVELSKKNMLLRGILVAILIITAMISFGYGVNELFSANKGWQEITASASGNGTCGSDFIFQYNLGVQQTDATVEKKRLMGLYSDICQEAYELFQNDLECQGIHNLYYINRHPNEKVEIDPRLYAALEKVEHYHNRMIYLAPIYDIYDDIFYCESDLEVTYYLPETNDEIREFYDKVLEYANQEEHIHIELLENNTIELVVSKEYEEYAKQEGIQHYFDFLWMKNAFIIDILADELKEKGYLNGMISSFDGYSISLGDLEECSYNLYSSYQGDIYQTGIMKYHTATSLVNLRNYPINSKDEYRFYKTTSQKIYTPYISLIDGKDYSSMNDFIGYSNELGCSDLVLSMIPIYVTDKADKTMINNLKGQKIEYIYFDQTKIYYSEENLVIEDLYDLDGTTFTTKWID